jgi:hypothetical protein
MAKTPQTGAARQPPVAPPVFRPQSTPRCLQLKSAAPPGSPPKLTQPRSIGTQSRGTIQRFGWALHDSDDLSKSKVVDTNLERSQSRYLHAETIYDANKKIDRLSRANLQPGEAIHLHAHGAEDRLANLSVDTLANVLTSKFGLEGLAGRVIVMHSCNTGHANYGGEVLAKLVELAKNKVDLRGTTVYAPENYLVVESDGLSYVAKNGVGIGDLRLEPRKQHLQDLGDGWKAWTVNRSGVVASTNPGGIVAVMKLDEKTLIKPKLEGKSKSVKGKQKMKVEQEEPPPLIRIDHGGYYDDPSLLSRWEKDFIKRAFESGSYPPSSGF